MVEDWLLTDTESDACQFTVPKKSLQNSWGAGKNAQGLHRLIFEYIKAAYRGKVVAAALQLSSKFTFACIRKACKTFRKHATFQSARPKTQANPERQ